MNAVTQPETSALLPAPRQQFDLSPQTFEQALTFANYLADSDMVPKDFKGKPANCLIGMQWGMELGMKPLQAIQNIAVINGRPNLWGDAMLALVRSSPLCEYVVEDWHPDGTAYCKAKRRGEPEQIRTFSDADAKLAGLLGKQGPWTTGPKRMKQLRARGFALRDVFTDVLRGMGMAEEALDTVAMTEPKHMGMVDEVKTAAAAPYPQEKFDTNLKTWAGVIKSGRKKPAEMVAWIEAKQPLTEEQRKTILALGEQPAAAASDAPAVTYAEVADKLNKAADMDKLAESGSLIAAVADEAQRKELGVLYDRRAAELTPQ